MRRFIQLSRFSYQNLRKQAISLAAPRIQQDPQEMYKLGHTINDVDVNNLTTKQFEDIKDALWTHGVICIKNQKLTMDQQIAFTQKWGKLMILPIQQAYTKRDPNQPAIVRVGNINIDGSIKENCSDTEYWHKDGDFKKPGENFFISILIPYEIAQVGGQTGFVCSEQVYRDLPENLKEMLQDAQIIIRSQTIGDFQHFKENEHYPEAFHPVFLSHPITGRKIFNICQNVENDILFKDGTVKSSKEFISEIEKTYKIYSHQWEMGDVVIWDNIRVIHKSMGGFGNNRRLLIRTQAQILY
ncbi:taurine catabolism dioxygenase, TauD/TfdA family protein (macronuclear) [Tetrahymena thermophila SB210]|uniref:Taurine catabolism dioxygenase, TauD/TfdA family protein n=1 Tax=Tetrahymena thermophila (strain SB210) TaxID=312017 RepID=I7MFD6_TETTS|nr:taurine catabolism dioxygenase, TauD/TfdA family protein [Tetrahymena thermophila SB210]EAR83816.1 taurine catabolism dioxygenase, TauD/TfdA family protein [Tetrahymena thermophila SB210]|eukprot:XP_001031479.1 taurine catabolism dioxygenase, TauD/TfdA family protein [Tetrahymena thermophila SB210]